MRGWDLLEGAADDLDDAISRWRSSLGEDRGRRRFPRFVEGCFARAHTPVLRAAYDEMDGPWARDWGFRGFVGGLLLLGEGVFEGVLADPERLADGDPPEDAQDFLTTLLEIGVELPSAIGPDPDASFPRILAWRAAWYRPVELDGALGRTVAKALADHGECDAGAWGRFQARRGEADAVVTFRAGRVFRGAVPPRDDWTRWFSPLRDNLAPHREFVVPQLGAFRTERHPARQGSNPVTGQPIVIPEHWVPRFRADPAFLDSLPAPAVSRGFHR